MKTVSKEFEDKFKVLIEEAKGLSTAPYWDSTAGSRVERAAEEAEEAFTAS